MRVPRSARIRLLAAKRVHHLPERPTVEPGVQRNFSLAATTGCEVPVMHRHGRAAGDGPPLARELDTHKRREELLSDLVGPSGLHRDLCGKLRCASCAPEDLVDPERRSRERCGFARARVSRPDPGHGEEREMVGVGLPVLE